MGRWIKRIYSTISLTTSLGGCDCGQVKGQAHKRAAPGKEAYHTLSSLIKLLSRHKRFKKELREMGEKAEGLRICRKQGCRRNEAEIHSLRRLGFRGKNKSSVNIPEPLVEVSC